jgi:hypothetical protein
MGSAPSIFDFRLGLSLSLYVAYPVSVSPALSPAAFGFSLVVAFFFCVFELRLGAWAPLPSMDAPLP